MTADLVMVPRVQLEQLCSDVRDLTQAVSALLDTLAPADAEETPAPAMHSGFARFRAQQGGKRG